MVLLLSWYMVVLGKYVHALLGSDASKRFDPWHCQWPPIQLL